MGGQFSSEARREAARKRRSENIATQLRRAKRRIALLSELASLGAGDMDAD